MLRSSGPKEPETNQSLYPSVPRSAVGTMGQKSPVETKPSSKRRNNSVRSCAHSPRSTVWATVRNGL